jgi:hypothetical protein
MRPALRHPPAFSIDVEPDPTWQMLQAGLCALALGLLLLSVLMHQQAQPSWLAYSALCAVVLASSAWFWRRLPQARGKLAWDGQQWLWRDAGAKAGVVSEPKVVTITLVLDWGEWCLLRLQHTAPMPGWRSALGARRQYLAVAQGRQRLMWGLLRTCLAASAE